MHCPTSPASIRMAILMEDCVALSYTGTTTALKGHSDARKDSLSIYTDVFCFQTILWYISDEARLYKSNTRYLSGCLRGTVSLPHIIIHCGFETIFLL